MYVFLKLIFHVANNSDNDISLYWECCFEQ